MNISDSHKLYIYLLWLVSIGVVLTGCPTGSLPPIMHPVPLSEVSTEQVSQLINARMAAFQSLKGLGKVRIQSWEEKYKFSEAFVLEMPKRFRLETLGVFDQPAVFLLSDGDFLSLYSKKQNILYVGVASRENFFRLSEINLPAEDLILVFSGNPTRLGQLNFEWGMPMPETQQYYLERISLAQNIVQRIWFNTQLQVISSFEEVMLTNGEVLMRVGFDEYRAEAGVYPIPRIIRIERPFDHTKVEIQYKSFTVNATIAPEVFQFTPPANVQKYFIDQMTPGQLEKVVPYEEFRTHED